MAAELLSDANKQQQYSSGISFDQTIRCCGCKEHYSERLFNNALEAGTLHEGSQHPPSHMTWLLLEEVAFTAHITPFSCLE